VQAQTGAGPSWAMLIVWAVVNAVCLLRAVGFLSRIPSGSMAVNHRLGDVIAALAVPAAVALVAFVRAGSGWQLWIGPAVFVVFVATMVAVEYVRRIEFRSPPRCGILAPYLALFFGSFVLMRVPMFRVHGGLWSVTVASALFLIASMVLALRKGVG
jgi:hypothetical protein